MPNPVVIIPSKSASNLVQCLTALRKHEPDCRVIVVDDGLDCVVDVEVQYERHITFVEGAKPFVFARNVNIGIRAAGDSDVVILNDDALLESPGGFQLLQKAALNRPEVGIIGAVTNVTGQPLQTRSGGYRGDPKYGLRIVPHIAFVCVLIPRRTIEAVGLLDERYCLDYGVEDRDYCEAVTRAGLKVAVHDGCFVDHGSLTSTFRGDPRAPKRFDKNYALFKEKWGIA